MADAAQPSLAASALPARPAPAAGCCSQAHPRPSALAHPCPQEATAAPGSVKMSQTALNRQLMSSRPNVRCQKQGHGQCCLSKGGPRGSCQWHAFCCKPFSKTPGMFHQGRLHHHSPEFPGEVDRGCTSVAVTPTRSALQHQQPGKQACSHLHVFQGCRSRPAESPPHSFVPSCCMPTCTEPPRQHLAPSSLPLRLQT